MTIVILKALFQFQSKNIWPAEAASQMNWEALPSNTVESTVNPTPAVSCLHVLPKFPYPIMPILRRFSRSVFTFLDKQSLILRFFNDNS